MERDYVVDYDSNGNTTSTGLNWVFKYNAYNQLTEAYRRDPSTGSAGTLFAKFRYDALGRRIAAAYDLTPAVTGNGDLDDETVEFFAYDSAWRVIAIYRQGPEGSGGAPSGERPAPVAYERIAYASLPGARGGHPLLDCPVLSQIDENADGTFERERRYLQNTFGDIVQVVEIPGRPTESIRYSVYGYPVLARPDADADYDNDGDVGADADIEAFFACLGGNCDPSWDPVDIDRDGDIGTDADIEAFFQVLSGSNPYPPQNIGEHRFGWRGYWWDAHLEVYHVRHRVYDPKTFRWLQRDPAGFVDGLNLYAYCGGDPVNGIDPMGLDNEDTEDDRGYVYWFTHGWRGIYWWPKRMIEIHEEEERQRKQRQQHVANDATSFAEVEVVSMHYQSAATDFNRIASDLAQVGGNALRAGALMVLVAIPGPEDVVIAAIASRYGARVLVKIGTEIYAKYENGAKVLIRGEDAARATSRFDELEKLGKLGQELRESEVETMIRLSEKTGRKVRPADHKGIDYIDEDGHTYDAIGGGAAGDKLDIKEYTSSFMEHYRHKTSTDRVVVDVTGMSPQQKKAVRELLDGLCESDKARTIELGF